MKWRAETGELYYYFNKDKNCICSNAEVNSEEDDTLYKENNYFKTVLEAQIKEMQENTKFEKYIREKLKEIPYHILVGYNNMAEENDYTSKDYIFVNYDDVIDLLAIVHNFSVSKAFKLGMNGGYRNDFPYFKFDISECKFNMCNNQDIYRVVNFDKLAECVANKYNGFEKLYGKYKKEYDEKEDDYNNHTTKKITFEQYLTNELILFTLLNTQQPNPNKKKELTHNDIHPIPNKRTNNPSSR